LKDALFWADLHLNETANHCSGDRALDRAPDTGESGSGILPSLACLYSVCKQPIIQATHKPNFFFVYTVKRLLLNFM